MINFLKDLSEIEDLDNNFDKIFQYRFKRLKNIDEISFFNQAIDLNNEDLFYYKSKIDLCLNLMTNNDFLKEFDKFNSKQRLLKKLFEKNIFENKEIIKNDDKLNFFMFLIIVPQEDDTNEYDLNLLSSNNFIDNIDDVISETKFKKCIIEGKNAITRDETIFYYDKLKDLCKDNFIKYFKSKEKINNKYNIEDI